jgi:Tfp pilus assembly pilus retraction ATPase PilT
MATLHASDAGEVVDRLMAFFPDSERRGHQQVLAGQLLGIFCQKLVPAAAGGMVLACEYMTNVGITRQCILEADIPLLRDHLIEADATESCDFLRAFHSLVMSGKVSEETAMASVPNPAELRRRLKGISSNLS